MQRFATLFLTVLAAEAAVATGHEPCATLIDSLLQPVVVGGGYSVDVCTEFPDGATNLSAINLPATGQLAVAGDASRLPALVTIPAGFPVRVDLVPAPLALLGLEFEGVADVWLTTTNLPYAPDTRLRLFSAHNDGDPFIDITEFVTEGSYRVRGSRGEFSQFLVAEDNRDPAAIVNTKFSRVNNLLTTYETAMDTALYATLTNLITNAETNWSANNIDAAKSGVQSFESAIISAAGTPGQIPNLWKWDESVTNVAGLLRAAAGTLLFSLEDARDSDLDGIYDIGDNCLLVKNADQCDTDGDGFGNLCDADLDNNNVVNTFDLAVLRAAFGTTGAHVADLDCNNIVNTFDLTRLREAFGNVPGP